MRKIVAGLFVSANGVVEAPDTWTGPYFTPEIGQLKQRPGRNINISGSGTLVSWLLREGLLDQLDLLQFPVVVGPGKRLFEGEGGQAGLRLAGSQTFSTGVVHLIYQRAGG